MRRVDLGGRIVGPGFLEVGVIFRLCRRDIDGMDVRFGGDDLSSEDGWGVLRGSTAKRGSEWLREVAGTPADALSRSKPTAWPASTSPT